MVIGCGLQAEHHLLKTVLHFERFRLNQEFLEAIIGIIKEHPFVERPAGCRAEEGIVPFLGDIHPDDQIFR
jgi:hypothetical protein